jgi:hypothetical protein
MQTVMVDRYVGVRYNIKSAEDDFEIFDVEKDPRQAHNLAADPDMAAIQTQLKARALQARRPDPGAPRPYDKAPVPAVEPAALTKGKIRCRVYEGSWPWVPDFRTLSPVSTQMADRIDAALLPRKPNTGVAFEGYFHAPAEGEYTFFAASEGGSQVFLHDARVIDDDFARTGAEVSGTIRLAAGWHPLRVYTRQTSAKPRLTLEYSGPSIARQPIASTALAAAQ